MTRPIYRYLLLITIATLIIGCSEDSPIVDIDTPPISASADTYDSYLVSEWAKLYLALERNKANFKPAATSRAMAYIHMAAYHAAHPGMPNTKSLKDILPQSNLPEFNDYEKPYQWLAAVNMAYKITHEHFVLDVSPEEKASIEALYLYWKTTLSQNIDPDIITRSENWGSEVALKMIEYAKTDIEAENQLKDATPDNYIAPVGLGLWRGIHGPAYYPYWGSTRTFAPYPDLSSIVLPPLTPSLDPQSPFFKEALEVNDTLNNLPLVAKWIAEFWSDDINGLTFSPPARQIAIAEQLLHLEHMTLGQGLVLMCKLGMAINDAAVVCWYGKYQYNIIRPDEFIIEHINPNFTTLLDDKINRRSSISPSFPAYPSGHSTFASAAAGIFIRTLGDYYPFTDRCHEGRTEFLSKPRGFLFFSDMAEENAYSRIPLGVHFRMDCDEGLRLGYITAERINTLFE